MQRTVDAAHRRVTFRRVRLSLVREKSRHPYPAGSIRTASQVVDLARSVIGDDPREHFIAIYLDGRHKVAAVHDVSIGTGHGAPVQVSQVFLPAVHLAAEAVVVAHNHPSGDATPSVEDRAVTERLKQAGELLGIQLLDHVVLGAERYFSFADESYQPISNGSAKLPGSIGVAGGES